MSKIPEIKGSYEILKQDILAKSLIKIDTVHSRIHQGSYFNVTDIDTDVDIAVPKQYLFITPNTQTRIHFIFGIESEPGSTVDIFEDTTVSDNGVALARINSRRDVTFTSEMLVYRDPTVTLDGTLLYTRRSGTTSIGGKIALDLLHINEFIFDVNSKYQIKITPLLDNTVTSMYCNWYELR